MTHNEKRTNWLKEGAIGLSVGVLYGTCSVMVGHPLDTIKTKMQAQRGFENTSMVRTLAQTLKTQGVIGLYRGCVPPLLGSGIYRSTQFAVFEAVYTYCDEHPILKKEIPGTFGIQARVFIGGACGATARAIIETPLELAKVRRQTGQTYQIRGLYKGFSVTLIRTLGLMGTFFVLVDSFRRHVPHLFASPIAGPFLLSGTAATIAWWIVWPMENMKSQVQSNFGKEQSLASRLAYTARERGIRGLYRGIGPGTLRSFLANGTSMVVMSNAQKLATKLGLRDS